MGKLDGKVAIVTGAARGLGRAYARRLAGLGAKVAVADLDLHSYEEFDAEAKDMTADSTVAEIQAAGGQALGIELDVTDRDAVEAMVAEVVHGAPYRFRDPARFSLAHGGKDRHPYPVPIKVYDETIRVLKSAVQKAKLGRDEEMQALKRLDNQARQLERTATGPSFESFVTLERTRSSALGGRSVFGWEADLTGTKEVKP